MVSAEKQIKICRPTLKSLRWSLIWPNKKEELAPGKWYYIQIATFLVITSGWALSVAMHLITILKSRADVHVSEDVAVLLAITGIYYITFFYVKNQPKIAVLLRDMSYFDRFGEPPGFEKLENRLGFWSRFCYCYAAFGVTIITSFKLYRKDYCEKKFLEKGLEENCGFFSSVWFPFRINYFPVYQLVQLYMFISTQVHLRLGLMISFNVMEIANHIILRIKHLNTMIKRCFDDDNYIDSRKKMKRCILYHWELLNYSDRLNKYLSNCMFAHFAITAAICGCLQKQYIDGDNDNKLCAALHCFGWIMALFVACIGGQRLIEASESIPEALMASKWYETDIQLRKDLLFMLTRSQKNLYVNVGSFSKLSFPLFVSVLKMSYSILAMLKS